MISVQLLLQGLLECSEAKAKVSGLPAEVGKTKALQMCLSSVLPSPLTRAPHNQMDPMLPEGSLVYGLEATSSFHPTVWCSQGLSGTWFRNGPC